MGGNASAPIHPSYVNITKLRNETAGELTVVSRSPPYNRVLRVRAGAQELDLRTAAFPGTRLLVRGAPGAGGWSQLRLEGSGELRVSAEGAFLYRPEGAREEELLDPEILPLDQVPATRVLYSGGPEKCGISLVYNDLSHESTIEANQVGEFFEREAGERIDVYFRVMGNRAAREFLCVTVDAGSFLEFTGGAIWELEPAQLEDGRRRRLRLLEHRVEPFEEEEEEV